MNVAPRNRLIGDLVTQSFKQIKKTMPHAQLEMSLTAFCNQFSMMSAVALFLHPPFLEDPFGPELARRT